MAKIQAKHEGGAEDAPVEQKPKKEKKQANEEAKQQQKEAPAKPAGKGEEKKAQAPPAQQQQQEQPKKQLDFISALKATNVTEEQPKKTHAQIMKEQLGGADNNP